MKAWLSKVWGWVRALPPWCYGVLALGVTIVAIMLSGLTVRVEQPEEVEVAPPPPMPQKFLDVLNVGFRVTAIVEWDGVTAKDSMAYLAVGDATLGVDLSAIDGKNNPRVSLRGGKMEVDVYLPYPKVTNAGVDFNAPETGIVDVNDRGWPMKAAQREKMELYAQDQSQEGLQRAARESYYQELATAQAQQIIEGFYRSAGAAVVRVHWGETAPPGTPSEIQYVR